MRFLIIFLLLTTQAHAGINLSTDQSMKSEVQQLFTIPINKRHREAIDKLITEEKTDWRRKQLEGLRTTIVYYLDNEDDLHRKGSVPRVAGLYKQQLFDLFRSGASVRMGSNPVKKGE